MPTPKPRILVVDDDADIRRVIRKALPRESYGAVFCRNAIRAPRLVLKYRPDVIVLDAHFASGMNGFTLCAVLKQAINTRHVPVVMISGHCPPEQYAEKARKLGAAAFIEKVKLVPDLKDSIDRLIAAAPKAQASASTADAGELLPTGTVLVVDDDEIHLDLVKAWLKNAGHRVIVTADESKVVELAVANRPDCIVLDFLLRRCTAQEVIQRLRARDETRAVPVVVLSSLKDKKNASLNLGADHFVLKGGKPEELLQRVAVFIRRYHWSAGILTKGDLRLDRRDCSVCLDQRPVATLVPKRFDLLYALVRNSPRCVTAEELAVESGHAETGGSQALEKIALRMKEDVGEVIGGRVHHLKNLGWLYQIPMEPRLAHKS